jgi:hypothetical protein
MSRDIVDTFAGGCRDGLERDVVDAVVLKGRSPTEIAGPTGSREAAAARCGVGSSSSNPEARRALTPRTPEPEADLDGRTLRLRAGRRAYDETMSCVVTGTASDRMSRTGDVAWT